MIATAQGFTAEFFDGAIRLLRATADVLFSSFERNPWLFGSLVGLLAIWGVALILKRRKKE